MSATEAHPTAGKSLDPGKEARYAASIRLSVAPMMDWIDVEKNVSNDSALHVVGKFVLQMCFVIACLAS